MIDKEQLFKVLDVDNVWEDVKKTQQEIIDSVKDLVDNETLIKYQNIADRYADQQTKDLYKDNIFNNLQVVIESGEIEEEHLEIWMKINAVGKRMNSIVRHSVTETADAVDTMVLGPIDKSKLN